MKLAHATIAASIIALLVMGAQLVPEPASRSGKKSPPTLPSATLIRDVRVFDGERTWPRASVLLRDGRIEAIAETLPAPAGAEIVEGAGKTLLPGLIDGHVHTWGDARRDALRFGVTTQLDMFSDHRQLAASRSERASLAPTDRADLWSAGSLATAAGGHGTQFGLAIPTLATPADAPAWVADRKAEGSDFIKLVREDLQVYSDEKRLPSLDAATAAAVIAAAHDAGLRAVVHASAQEAARESLRDGADGLVHLFQDAPADEAFVALAAAKGAFVVPTLTVIAGFAGEPSSLADDPRIAPLLTAGQRQSLASRLPHGGGNASLIAHARDSIRRLQAAGVTLLAGTDAPNPNTAHGASLHEELAQLVRAGLSAEQSLVAATSAPARVFGLADRGRIAAGLRADVVLVEGDPTTDITATRAIVGIWKNGARVDRSVAAETSAPRLAARVVGSFDGEGEDFPGAGWNATTDQMMGGQSTVVMSRLAGGADGSAGALRVAGTIAAGQWPWAGVMFSPGAEPMAAVDAGATTELVLQARGDGREYVVMLFSGAESQGAPTSLRIRPGRDWGEIRLRLADFPGADLARLRAVGFAAGLPAGDFLLDIDQVEIR